MITLITGVPGSGKTLYAIAELLLPVLGRSVTVTRENEEPFDAPYKIFSNIRGFQFDAELVEAGPAWVSEGKEKWSQPPGNRLGLHNWHEWAKPGSVLVPDEFQKIWPPRPNGSPIPPDVQAMDTHRHMAVDFVLITQKFSFDMHIRGLVGRHLHVRRIGNTPLAIVYEWDGCSHNLSFSKALARRPWRFPKKVYSLYHSADAHTKQPRKLPTLIYVVLGALALAAWKIPDAYSRIAGKGQEHELRMAKHTGAKDAGRASAAPHAPASLSLAPLPAAAASAPVPELPPLQRLIASNYSGCIALPTRCQCFGADGLVVPGLDMSVCRQALEVVRLAPSGQGYVPQFAPTVTPSMPGEYPLALPPAEDVQKSGIRLNGVPL